MHVWFKSNSESNREKKSNFQSRASGYISIQPDITTLSSGNPAVKLLYKHSHGAEAGTLQNSVFSTQQLTRQLEKFSIQTSICCVSSHFHIHTLMVHVIIKIFLVKKKKLSPSVFAASYFGDSYCRIDAIQDLSSFQVSLQFKTSRRSGLLLLAAGHRDYLSLELYNGRLQVRYILGSNPSRGQLTFRSATAAHVLISPH